MMHPESIMHSCRNSVAPPNQNLCGLTRHSLKQAMSGGGTEKLELNSDGVVWDPTHLIKFDGGRDAINEQQDKESRLQKARLALLTTLEALRKGTNIKGGRSGGSFYRR